VPISTPPLNPHPFPSNWGRKMAAHYVAWRICAGAGDRTRLVTIIIVVVGVSL